MIALAPESSILCYAAVVDRGLARRIISLRRAHRREVKHDVESTQAPRRCHANDGGGPGHHVGSQGRSGGATADPEAFEGDGAAADAARPPKSGSPKLLVSVRYSQEVLAYFKSTGEGWQSRMDGVLREYVTRQSRRAQR